jgi:hypothetical protein
MRHACQCWMGNGKRPRVKCGPGGWVRRRDQRDRDRGSWQALLRQASGDAGTSRITRTRHFSLWTEGIRTPDLLLAEQARTSALSRAKDKPAGHAASHGILASHVSHVPVVLPPNCPQEGASRGAPTHPRKPNIHEPADSGQYPLGRWHADLADPLAAALWRRTWDTPPARRGCPTDPPGDETSLPPLLMGGISQAS